MTLIKEIAMNTLDDFFRFLDNSTSPFQVIKNSSEILEHGGFQHLSFEEDWDLQKGGSYYVKLFDTALYAFKIGKDIDEGLILRMAVAHTDFPSLRIKPNPEIKEKSFLKLNTEVYGGMILNSWFDRALSIAGKVALRSKQAFQTNEILVDFKRPLMVIPNLAIHLNRDVNKGVEVNKQTDILPLLGMTEDKADNYLKNLLASELKVPVEDILDYDLFVYNLDKAQSVGVNREFICSPRLDDLSSVYALMQGILGKVCEKDIHMICLFDNEEVGNQTKQGCDTQFTDILLEKIMQSLGKTRTNLFEVLSRSFILSADVAQAYHPNYPTKYDPTNIAELNKGIALKIATTQRYAYDTGAVAIVQQLCEMNDIPFQKFVNRSDATAGSTMGPSISTSLAARTLDIGVPLLAMHSATETIGTKDQESIIKFMKVYFSEHRV